MLTIIQYVWSNVPSSVSSSWQGRSWPGGERGQRRHMRFAQIRWEMCWKKLGGVADVCIPLNELSKYRDSVAECRSNWVNSCQCPAVTVASNWYSANYIPAVVYTVHSLGPLGPVRPVSFRTPTMHPRQHQQLTPDRCSQSSRPGCWLHPVPVAAIFLFYCTQLRFVQLFNKAYDDDDDDELATWPNKLDCCGRKKFSFHRPA